VQFPYSCHACTLLFSSEWRIDMLEVAYVTIKHPILSAHKSCVTRMFELIGIL